MIAEFEHLNAQEVELMLKAPVLVCILIAGADGNIDNAEMREAINVFKKQRKSYTRLTDYFQIASQDIEDKLKIMIQSYPYESTQREPLIVQELSGLNSLWTRLHPDFAKGYYNMLKTLAGKVAASSGGLLGYHSVGSEEARYIHLSMIRSPG